MLAGILQIRSPSGSNGWHIPKIKLDTKKQPAFLQAALVAVQLSVCFFGPSGTSGSCGNGQQFLYTNLQNLFDGLRMLLREINGRIP